MSSIKKRLKYLLIVISKFIWILRVTIVKSKCPNCFNHTIERKGYNRIFLECINCGFIFTGDFPEIIANMGMGMDGSWGNADSGGEREDYLVRMIQDDLKKQSFLLYGVGSTLAFPVLLSEGFDVYGCDLSKSVIQYRQKVYGSERFFHVNNSSQYPNKFDVIIACEVFEHFRNPQKWISLIMSCLKNNGIICGTTNFYPGGNVEDTQKVGYMSFIGHVAYWSEKSMSYIFQKYGMELITFEMYCPGSVVPDPKYHDLFPNKRVFFCTSDNNSINYFKKMKKNNPILPIDISNYPHEAYK